MLATLGGWEIAAIVGVVLLLFGAKKLPELAKGLGKGIHEFKKASREVQDEIERAGEEPPPPAPRSPSTYPPADQRQTQSQSSSQT